MLKKYLSLALALLLTNLLFIGRVWARTPHNSQSQTVEQIKIKVAKLGTGERARATVRMKDGTKIKGYIAEARDNDFVIRDRQTHEPRNVLYRDVARVESNRGHSLARNLGLGIVIGAVGVLAVFAAIVAADN